ncbi:hypothetical protein H2136_23240 [Aeromonas hydrophila]|uniref:Uncharacterized protein n=1 Tax=Aeromonas hydrophila TaxID=644 RepID=A0A926IU01_AERHY|nr:hypothetical protein [Aeromonas hydrophila]
MAQPARTTASPLGLGLTLRLFDGRQTAIEGGAVAAGAFYFPNVKFDSLVQ